MPWTPRRAWQDHKDRKAAATAKREAEAAEADVRTREARAWLMSELSREAKNLDGREKVLSGHGSLDPRGEYGSFARLLRATRSYVKRMHPADERLDRISRLDLDPESVGQKMFDVHHLYGDSLRHHAHRRWQATDEYSEALLREIVEKAEFYYQRER